MPAGKHFQEKAFHRSIIGIFYKLNNSIRTSTSSNRKSLTQATKILIVNLMMINLHYMLISLNHAHYLSLDHQHNFLINYSYFKREICVNKIASIVDLLMHT